METINALVHKQKSQGGFPLIENFPRTGTERKIYRRKEGKIFLC